MGEGRLRFEDFTFQRLPNGRCRAKVVLAWADGRRFEGAADGVTSQTGELRCCAAAAVQALERSVETKLTFELLGVKAVRAPAPGGGRRDAEHDRAPEEATRLVGSCLTENDPPRGAALAVLNATNRLLGNFLATR